MVNFYIFGNPEFSFVEINSEILKNKRDNCRICHHRDFPKEITSEDIFVVTEDHFDYIRTHDEIWERTVFILENEPLEDPISVDEMPFLLWAHDTPAKIAERIWDAAEKVVVKKEDITSLMW